MQIAVFDTSIISKNLGDEIIMEAVLNQIQNIFPQAFFVKVATHDFMGLEARKLVRGSDLSIVGGTNLLTSNLFKYRQWKLSFLDAIWLKDCVLMGVGWWQYQNAPNLISRFCYNRVLNSHIQHAVRDNYTMKQLKTIGIKNVINTGCPTMWDISEDLQNRIPRIRGESVITTFTDYKPDPINDQENLDVLLKNYGEVYIWPQGSDDYSYIRNHLSGRFKIIDPNLSSYDGILKSGNDIDYVGTRLHAGIRAIRAGKRSIILSVDNRAAEMSRDIGLTTCRRDDSEGLKNKIVSDFETQLSIPWDAIDTWRCSLAQAVGSGAIEFGRR